MKSSWKQRNPWLLWRRESRELEKLAAKLQELRAQAIEDMGEVRRRWWTPCGRG